MDMRYERFKDFAQMVAWVQAQPTGFHIESGIYPEGAAFRPQLILWVEGGETVYLRWYAFADEVGLDFYKRTEARLAADGYEVAMKSKLA